MIANNQNDPKVEYMISEIVQFVNGLDIGALRRNCPTVNLLHSIDTLIDIPAFIQNAKDCVSFPLTLLKGMPIIGAWMPLWYNFPTNRTVQR